MLLTDASAAPLGEGEFAEAMAAAGPFESAPLLAVAVSGGADSMALCLLADRWARDRGGRVFALSVDHGLRPASVAEAHQVGRWMQVLGIEHDILSWRGDKPDEGLAARARAARYRLLAERCLARGLLHLLVAHHLADQAETVVLRASRGSGRDGLAAMAGVVETGAVRIVRPLLAVPPGRLRAYLQARGQAWLEDPSNSDLRYARNRIRRALADPALRAQPPEDLAATAAVLAAEREGRAAAVATLLARCCRIDPAGFATLDARVLLAAPQWAAAAALARTVTTIGGGHWQPARGKVERALRNLDRSGPSGGGPAGGTLGRCRYWWKRCAGEGGSGGVPAGGGTLVVCREGRALPAPVALDRAVSAIWDGRFAVETAGAQSGLSGPGLSGLWLGALGNDGWRQALALEPTLRRGRIPWQAAVVLPALRDAAGLAAVPALGIHRDRPLPEGRPEFAITFQPRRSLSGTSYFLA